ncbi:MAG: membrane protein insertase YidC [Chitinophagaceae bacterium]|nr:membrane protein insertase YidC [Bacteroidota bacterium]MCC6257387.1 membrane protein insertase YidC [Chitinophagaceae bacterium]MCW5916224.1 membrane protein insertase YidC [Ferruginibacter sp.]
MGFDRNTIIGFVLIGALLIGMFYINSKSQLSYQAEQKRIADSIAATRPKIDTAAVRLDSLRRDSVQVASQTKNFQENTGTETITYIENDVLKVGISNKGGQPKWVELKKYKKYDGSPLVLVDGSFNRFDYTLNAGNGTVQSNQLYYIPTPVTTGSDGTKSISFSIGDSSGKSITHQFTLHPNNYALDLNILTRQGNQFFTQRTIPITWKAEAIQVEKNLEFEKTQGHISFMEAGDYDSEMGMKSDDKKFSKPVDWFAIQQQFFAQALIAKTKFSNAAISWSSPSDTSIHVISRTELNARVALSDSVVQTASFQFFYGPSDYHILKRFGNGMEEMVPYGSGIFAFVKYINRYFLLPVFDFLQRNIASAGIAILLLTLLIRLITSPILYKSYVSAAKMRVLKPEVDALKEKFKGDQQAFSMEQMKLWRSAGVNPLGGCLPALLQIPIFMSLYYFFQANIDLRGKSFLWAKDLASYDSIAHLPFSIPFYGDHVSLFTLTATVTSLLISIYSMSNMQDQSNPVMKYMPYVFPVLLLGVFNRLPAALTWYYTISNIITLILQFVIQKYIINHDKILEQLNENRKKPVKKSKFAERLEAMQEQQKKLQEMKAKKSGK